MSTAHLYVLANVIDRHYMEGLKYDPEHTKCKAEFKVIRKRQPQHGLFSVLRPASLAYIVAYSWLQRLNKLEKAMKAGEEKFGQNSIQEALEDFETAISLEPDNQFVTPGLYLSKCRCHLKVRHTACVFMLPVCLHNL